jgi:hypothetical protein
MKRIFLIHFKELIALRNPTPTLPVNGEGERRKEKGRNPS